MISQTIIIIFQDVYNTKLFFLARSVPVSYLFLPIRIYILSFIKIFPVLCNKIKYYFNLKLLGDLINKQLKAVVSNTLNNVPYLML